MLIHYTPILYSETNYQGNMTQILGNDNDFDSKLPSVKSIKSSIDSALESINSIIINFSTQYLLRPLIDIPQIYLMVPTLQAIIKQ